MEVQQCFDSSISSTSWYKKRRKGYSLVRLLTALNMLAITFHCILTPCMYASQADLVKAEGG